MTPATRSRASAALEMEDEPQERRAMVRVARIATGRAERAPSRDVRPSSQPHAASPTVWQQTAEAATGWMCLAPFLFVSPFLWNPPLWIAALAQLTERDTGGSRR